MLEFRMSTPLHIVDEDRSYMIGAVDINGTSFHVKAFEVKPTYDESGDKVQRYVGSADKDGDMELFGERFERLANAIDPGEPFETVTIDGSIWVLVITPFAQ